MEKQAEKQKTTAKETLLFFAWPVILSGYMFFSAAALNISVSLMAGWEKMPFAAASGVGVAVGLAGMLWGWRAWKKAKKMDLLDRNSEFLLLGIRQAMMRKNLHRVLFVFSCCIFGFGWLRPGGGQPVMLLLAAFLCAFMTRKYLTSKAEFEFLRQKEEQQEAAA